MVSENKIILVGYSGHGYVVAESALLLNLPLKFYCEFNEMINNPYKFEYIGFERDADFKGWGSNYSFILGIGDNNLRIKTAKFILDKNKLIHTVINPFASISKYAHIGDGSFIARNVIINPFVSIGNYCIINTGSIIEHECVIGDGVHIAPGAVLLGNVKVGENSFIGANAVIKEGIVIGKNVIVGAGSVVLKDILDGEKIVGNPAKKKL